MAAKLEHENQSVLAGRALVHDGDTITLGGERIRLLGMDAPELDQTCERQGASYPCGRQARERLAQIVTGRNVTCQGGRRDRYDRLLATCTAGGSDISRQMVAEGWALATDDHRDAQREARAAERGLWSGSFEEPGDWRRRVHGEAGEAGALLEWLGAASGLW